MVDCWTGSLQIGATTQDPNTFQFPSTMTDLASGAWMLTADGVHHDGKIIGDEELGEAMDELKASVISRSAKSVVEMRHMVMSLPLSHWTN